MSANLFDQFISEQNFSIALEKIVRKKAAGGIDGLTANDFQQHSDKCLKRLRQEVESGRYLPEPTAGIHIPKFDQKNSIRRLGLPTVGDKVVQMAMLQVVEPRAENLFLDTSYGYRKGKGHFKAIRRVIHNLENRKLTWIVRQDVDDFFDTLDHDRLLSLFADLVDHDQRLIELVALWCKNGIVGRDGRWQDVMAGVRQGQVLSPLLANLYLHDLDQFAAGHPWGWVRYADDYLIQCPDQESALQADTLVKEFLRNHLSLLLNENPQPVCHIEKGFSFLGVRFQNRERSIDPDKINKMKRKLSYLLSPRSKAGLNVVFTRLHTMTCGWQRYYTFMEPQTQYAEIMRHMKSTLRVLIQTRTAAGIWPKIPPESITLPRLPDGQQKYDGRGALVNLWNLALRDTKNSKMLQKTDKKVKKRRQHYRKREICEGELVVLTPGLFIGKRGGRIIVRQKQQIQAEIISARMRSLTVAAHGVAISSDVILACQEHDIPVHFVDRLGNIIAVLQRPDSLRQEIPMLQLQHRDDATGMHLARIFILGKLKNQLAILKYFGKYKQKNRLQFREGLALAQPGMKKIISKVKQLPDCQDTTFRNRLMGLEGCFAAIYWRLIGQLLQQRCPFKGRIHQNATDPINCALNYGYGILYSHVHTALVKAGLSPAIGFLHAPRPGKPTLSWDVIEEFRAPVVDRSIISIINKGYVPCCDSQGFLDATHRKKISQVVINRLGSMETWHATRNTLKDIISKQALAIVSHLRGQTPFRPFITKW